MAQCRTPLSVEEPPRTSSLSNARRMLRHRHIHPPPSVLYFYWHRIMAWCVTSSQTRRARRHRVRFVLMGDAGRQLTPKRPNTLNEKTAVQALAALAQGMRLRIFRALVGAGPEGMTPGALAAMLDVPGSTLSFHLKELTHSGLVTQERDSRNLIYRPAIAHMNDLLDYLSQHCCQGAACSPRATAKARQRATC